MASPITRNHLGILGRVPFEGRAAVCLLPPVVAIGLRSLPMIGASIAALGLASALSYWRAVKLSQSEQDQRVIGVARALLVHVTIQRVAHGCATVLGASLVLGIWLAPFLWIPWIPDMRTSFLTLLITSAISGKMETLFSEMILRIKYQAALDGQILSEARALCSRLPPLEVITDEIIAGWRKRVEDMTVGPASNDLEEGEKNMIGPLLRGLAALDAQKRQQRGELTHEQQRVFGQLRRIKMMFDEKKSPVGYDPDDPNDVNTPAIHLTGIKQGLSDDFRSILQQMERPVNAYPVKDMNVYLKEIGVIHSRDTQVVGIAPLGGRVVDVVEELRKFFRLSSQSVIWNKEAFQKKINESNCIANYIRWYASICFMLSGWPHRYYSPLYGPLLSFSGMWLGFLLFQLVKIRGLFAIPRLLDDFSSMRREVFKVQFVAYICLSMRAVPLAQGLLAGYALAVIYDDCKNARRENGLL